MGEVVLQRNTQIYFYSYFFTFSKNTIKSFVFVIPEKSVKMFREFTVIWTQNTVDHIAWVFKCLPECLELLDTSSGFLLCGLCAAQ